MSTYTDEYDEKIKNHCQNLYSRMNEEQRQIQRDLINDVLEREGHLPRATPHNSARAGPEKIWVLIKALFRRCTLCTSRKSDEIRAQIFQEMPQADCAVLP